MKLLLKIFVPIFIFCFSLLLLLHIWTRFRPIHEEGYATIEIEWETIRPGEPGKLPGITDLFKEPGSITRQKVTNKYGLVFDATYSINEFGIRDDIGKDKVKKSHFILSGCSFIFGQSIQYEDTVPFILRNIAPEVNVRNLGFNGGGLHTSLRYLEISDLRQFIPEENGVFIYSFISDHYPRWIRDLTFLRWGFAEAPTYDYVNGKLGYAGKLGTHWEYKKYHFFKKFGIELPEFGPLQIKKTSDKAKLDSFMEGIVLLKERYLKLYPKGRFFWLIHPVINTQPMLEAAIRVGAKKYNIDVIFGKPDYENYLKTSGLKRDAHMIKWDGHPNGKFNVWFASWLKDKFL